MKNFVAILCVLTTDKLIDLTEKVGIFKIYLLFISISSKNIQVFIHPSVLEKHVNS